MKIAYIDLNAEDHWEDYSVNPKRYGGGRVFAATFKEKLPDFHIFANEKSFANVSKSESKTHCHALSWEQRKALRDYGRVADVIPDAQEYDLFVTFVPFSINTEGLKAASCEWAVGRQEVAHSQCRNLLQYNEYQLTAHSPSARVHRVVIGKPIPAFQEYKKEDFIFQCTRHTEIFGSINIAASATHLGIKAYFAGPIDANYPLLDFIDNKNTFYLGIISEEMKQDFLKKARLCTFYHTWNTPFNLSAIESLSYGTPIAATRAGFWPSLVTNTNGFFIDGLGALKRYWEGYPFTQRDCWESSLKYSEQNMIDSFLKAFEDIVNENNLP